MKKLLSMALLATLLAMPTAAWAFNLNEEVPIAHSAIPAAAASFLSQHFPGDGISIAMYEREVLSKEYTVILESGTKVQFDGKGEWKDIDMKRGVVPEAIVPAQIRSYVDQIVKGQDITDIKRNSKSWEIDLSNGMEVKFNSKFKPVEFDN